MLKLSTMIPNLTRNRMKLIRGLRTVPSSFRPSCPSMLISVEGNVGAGKSTLIELLKDRHEDWIFIAEPVGEWSAIKNSGGESLLEMYYKDKDRWSYSFQSCALLSRFQNIQEALLLPSKSKKFKGISSEEEGHDTRSVFVTERCLDTDYHVFAKMLRDNGSMDRLEFELYDRLFQHLRVSMTTQLSAIILVDTCPVDCLGRIKTRNRMGESNLSLEYLSVVERYQQDWMSSLKNVPVIKTDGAAGGSAMSEIESFVNRQLVSSRDRRTYNLCL